mmetsp:Transcript_97822/g.292201  ORF Transcript_97822/g.292201 Transcript_97822/m.292201 type:complete len:241 (+) Transcript_97822:201-923(+)
MGPAVAERVLHSHHPPGNVWRSPGRRLPERAGHSAGAADETQGQALAGLVADPGRRGLHHGGQAERRGGGQQQHRGRPRAPQERHHHREPGGRPERREDLGADAHGPRHPGPRRHRWAGGVPLRREAQRGGPGLHLCARGGHQRLGPADVEETYGHGSGEQAEGHGGWPHLHGVLPVGPSPDLQLPRHLLQEHGVRLALEQWAARGPTLLSPRGAAELGIPVQVLRKHARFLADLGLQIL